VFINKGNYVNHNNRTNPARWCSTRSNTRLSGGEKLMLLMVLAALLLGFAGGIWFVLQGATDEEVEED
jgi:hypothetical protein